MLVYCIYTTQVNSNFWAHWLASSEVISQIIFTYQQPKKKMDSCFASVSEEEVLSMNEAVVPKNRKMATKFGELFNLSSLISVLRQKVKIQRLVYENCRALKSQCKQWNTLMLYSLVSTTRGISRNYILRKWHRSNLTSACKSFICRQEGETEHFTIKNRLPLFRQPLIDTWEVHRWISFPLPETLFLQKQTNPSAIMWKLSAKEATSLRQPISKCWQKR